MKNVNYRGRENFFPYFKLKFVRRICFQTKEKYDSYNVSDEATR